MDFIFAPADQVDASSLRQGDLLLKTDALKAAIAIAHSYYAEAEDYTHFLVLTQSCDLVRRGGKPKSRYITVAAARPLSVVVARVLEKYRFPKFDFPVVVCSRSSALSAQHFLERLLHNTEDGYFFIRKDETRGINQDLCVFLPLSIALRVDHYDVCLSTKIAQLDNIFAAKVGWLAGNLYSRVATPDVEEKLDAPSDYKKAFYNEALFENTAWLTSQQFKTLKAKLGQWRIANPGQNISREQASLLLAELPEQTNYLADRAIDVLLDAEVLDRADQDRLARARAVLRNDTVLQRLVRM